MNYLIVFGGYLAKKEWVTTWANNLAKLKEYDDTWKVVPYEGPNDSLYRNYEIMVSKLAKELNSSTELETIKIVCHSSGAYPAYELISYIKEDILQHIDFIILDSDYGHGKLKLVPDKFLQMKSVTGVYAFHTKDGKTVNSSNATGIIKIGELLHPHAKIIKHDASKAGCNTHAIWSLHDSMIVKKVANPTMYDLKNDYGTNIDNLEHYWL